MADDIIFQSTTPATPPANSRVSTEEVTTLNGSAVTAQHIQRVAVAVRTADGVAADLPGSAADGLLVNLGANNDVSVTGTVTVQDGGGSITVDGPLTDTELRASAVPVSLASSPLASGASTSAKQDTLIGHVDGIETALTSLSLELAQKTEPADQQHVIVDSSALPTGASTAANQSTGNTALAAIQTAVETLDNAISGNEIQADIVGPLPPGTNNIGDVDVLSLPTLPAGTNNIGDVDVLTLPAMPTGDNVVGRVKLTDGTDVADVLDLTNSNPLVVAIVDANGDQVTSFGGGSGGTQYTEDAAAAANPVATALNLIRDDVRAGSLTTTDGDNVAARGTNAGELYVKHVDAIPVTDNGGSLTVDAASLPLPTGASTAANQTTGNTALSAIQTAVEILDNAISGSEMQVDVLTLPSITIGTALPAGANNIGDVDVASSALPSGASTSAKQDTIIGHLDGVQGLLTTIDGDTGTIAGAVSGSEMQVDVVAALPAGDNNIGNVDVVSSVLPSGAATLAEQQAETTHLATIAGDTADIEAAVELLDDTVATLGTTTYTEAATKGLVIGAIRRDADTTLVDTTNEVSPLQVDANGRLKVEAFSGETLPVSGTVTANAGTNLNTSALALETGGNLAGAAASLSVIDDWDESDRAKVNPIAGQAGVQGGSGAVSALTQRMVLATDVALPAGTNAIGKLAANSGVDIGDVDVTSIPGIVGTIADDATTPGAPVMIGGQAKETDGTDPGSVSAEDDVARAIFDRNRRQLVNNVHPNMWSLFEDHTSAQTNNQLKGAPGANLSLYITDIIFSNGATAGSIKLVEDEGGTPVQLTQTIYMAINGGAVMSFRTPRRMTANKSLGFTSVSCTTHSVEVHGYIAP